MAKQTKKVEEVKASPVFSNSESQRLWEHLEGCLRSNGQRLVNAGTNPNGNVIRGESIAIIKLQIWMVETFNSYIP